MTDTTKPSHTAARLLNSLRADKYIARNFADELFQLGSLIDAQDRLAALAGAAPDIEALRGMWRALVDAGGATTVARHGVERGPVEWANTVTNGMLAIERHLHPERFEDVLYPHAPAKAREDELLHLLHDMWEELVGAEGQCGQRPDDALRDRYNAALATFAEGEE